MTCSSSSFDLVHRPVCSGDELVGDFLACAGERNPDAGRDRDGVAQDRERWFQRRADSYGKILGIVGRADVFAQQDELVSGNSSECVAVANQVAEPIGDGEK